MTLPIPAGEIAVGDYSPEYGTVKQVEKTEDSVTLTFKNGTKRTLDKELEIFVDQGGRF